jgi:hypothetical protein
MPLRFSVTVGVVCVMCAMCTSVIVTRRSLLHGVYDNTRGAECMRAARVRRLCCAAAYPLTREEHVCCLW